jgi:hypothetical protein
MASEGAPGAGEVTILGNLTAAPRKEWFSAAEIAASGLPGVPASKRCVNALAEAEGWRARVDRHGAPLARARKGRGGGMEYHWTLLPMAARLDLVGRGAPRRPAQAVAVGSASEGAFFQAFLSASPAAKERALLRALAVSLAELHYQAGLEWVAAANFAAHLCGCSGRSIVKWWWQAAGVPEGLRPLYLVDDWPAGMTRNICPRLSLAEAAGR